jgi:hypothetical protein
MKNKYILLSLLLAFLSINCQKSSNEIRLGQISNKLIALDSNLVTLFDLPESCYNVSLSEKNKPKEITNIYCTSQYYETPFFYYCNASREKILSEQNSIDTTKTNHAALCNSFQ